LTSTEFIRDIVSVQYVHTVKENKHLEYNVEIKKMVQDEYASVKDSPKGKQLKNTDEITGTARFNKILI
jgi:hypothetical protein